MSSSALRCFPSLALLVLTGGCSTLGSNISGDFACRTPEGSCAPTTLIDAAATGISAPARAGSGPAAMAREATSTLQVVVAARRDHAGRIHEARVVHVPLPEDPVADWRAPLRTGDVLRAIGSSIAETRETGVSPLSDTPEQTPGLLHSPWQLVPAEPGASAPDPGGPSAFPPPRAPVPHPDPSEGESQ
ncbi:hypothetical protein [Erythrobacter sp. EC-HK427]|uniref:hypothetical protein n=1 Tax=Erythrobacter sp. EC-HK427 TaxID=2038396 RepID=UPI001259AB24|nr:hypothetical protein [Erythrobacter sp. EC-HK427]VVT00620.1 conserved hypothetical protein [Erythrobacter sp. EC-HK427]